MGMEFYTQSFPKARKQYKCDLCGKTIEPGKQYSCFTGKYDGEIFTSRNCMTCHAIINAYCAEYDETEYDEYEIREWLHDKYCDKCKHGGIEDDDCEYTEESCPFIREHYKGSVTA